MNLNFRNSKFALLLGAINGFIYGIAYQPVSAAYFEYYIRQVAIEFDGHSPSIGRPLRPLAEYILWIILFTLASYTVHRFWGRKVKSDVVLWQFVAIVAFAVPSVALYLISRGSSLIGAVEMKINTAEWGYVPELLPSRNDLEFAALFLGLAVLINLAFGAGMSLISKHFAK